MQRDLDKMALTLRSRTSHAVVVIGGPRDYYGLQPWYTSMCQDCIDRFLAHGIHAVSGIDLYTGIPHCGIHMLKGNEQQEQFRDRFVKVIGDCRKLSDVDLFAEG